MLFGDDDVSLAIILSVDDDPALLAVTGIDGDLDFGVRVDANVENLAVTREPGIRPTAVVTDADGSHAVDDG
jgi:hypothetical protein